MLENRKSYLLGTVLCIGAISFAYFIQYWEELDPCPFCIIERWILFSLGAVFILGTLQGSKTWGNKLYGLVLSTLSVIGLIVSGKHVWLQHQPLKQIASCTNELSKMLNEAPFVQKLLYLLKDSPECQIVNYRLFGFSLAELTLGMFIMLASISFYVLIMKKGER